MTVTIKDTVTSVIRTYAPSTFLNVSQNADLKLVFDGSGKYRLSFIPNKLFNITSSNDLVTQVELVVYKKLYTGPSDRSDGQPKIKFSCQ